MYEIFAALLEKKGLKAADVTRATGIKSPVFSEWKKGKSKPNTEKMIKIANFLGVSVEYLTTGKESDPEKNKQTPGVKLFHENGSVQTFDLSSVIYSICEAVSKMPTEQQELVNNMVGGKKRKIIYVENPQNRRPSRFSEPNAAHTRTDINIPKNVDISENDIMDDENF